MPINQDKQSVAREHLLSAVLNARIDHIEAHRVTLQPGQKSGTHVHPGGVVGCVLDGEVMFAPEGQPKRILGPGDVFFEPPGMTIAHFDNVSEAAIAQFIAFYPLTGAQPLVTMATEYQEGHDDASA